VDRGDSVQAAAADVDFHHLLCSYGSNAMLRSLAFALIDQMAMVTLAIYSLRQPAAASLAAHDAIIEALSHADASRAADLAYEHELDTSRHYLPTVGQHGDGAQRSTPTGD
jgi:DNA-binding GntR family transcriptional regulator